MILTFITNCDIIVLISAQKRENKSFYNKKERDNMVKEVALNIVAQVMFFVLNIFALPWFVARFSSGIDINAFMSNIVLNTMEDMKREVGSKYDDDKTRAKIVQLVKDNQYYKVKVKTIVVFCRICKKIYQILSFVKSWTIDLINQFVSILILFVTFNLSSKIKCSIGENKNLEIDCYPKSSKEKYRWLNPWMQVGKYVSYSFKILSGVAIFGLMVYLLLPSTFSSVASEIYRWSALQSVEFGFSYITNVVSTLFDILYNKLIVLGFKESPIVFTTILVVFVLLLSEDFIPLKCKDGKPHDAIFCWPVIAALIIAFNITFVIINPMTYSIISGCINTLGMIISLAIIIKGIATIIKFCPTYFIEMILD